MKKLEVFLISMLLIFSFAACSTKNTDSNSSATDTEASVKEQTSDTMGTNATISGEGTAKPEDSQTSIPATGGKTLVVYYSATGNTERIVEYIVAATNGATFRLEPKDIYTSADLDWTNQDSRVVYEHDHPEARDVELVKNTVDNWEEYDTIYIGYPIWWQIAAWPIDGFIEANDFTGKTVIPFCTSSSSGIGESAKLLEELAGTGNWIEGQRFSSGDSEQTVRDWIDGLGLQ